MNFPSQLVEEAVNQLSKLPGIGKKSALRFALHLLKADQDNSIRLAEAILKLRTETTYCQECHNISDAEICNICNNHNRDRSVVCIIEDTRDVLAVENTNQYRGLYHVLGGIISPIEGISPSDLNIDSLIKRVKQNEIKEVILALPATMEGDTTAFYISKKLKEFNIRISSIARGIPMGGELEYADEITLGRSILKRTSWEQ